MEVISLVAGFTKGPRESIELLDSQLADKLGDVIIHKLTDTLYCHGPFETHPLLIRVVVYDKK